MTPRYIIVAPSYSPDVGGSIFLHELAHALVGLGAEVALWPSNRMPIGGLGKRIRAVLRRPSRLWRQSLFVQVPGRNIPVLSKGQVHPDSIVVYPEKILGNPLGARNVVRWLLYRPGLLAPYRFGPDEMFFRAGEMSDLPEITGGAPDLFLWRINDAYRDVGRSSRKGACFLVRKGESKPRIPQTADALCIDGLSHTEIADIFNRCEVFYSYDEATFYSQYAALCGCLSVVVPGLYASREDWVAHHPPARYGVAYGLDDLEHARQTRHLVVDQLRAQEAAGLDTVRRFMALTDQRFPLSAPLSRLKKGT